MNAPNTQALWVVLACIVGPLLARSALADAPVAEQREQRVAKRFEQLAGQPPRLRVFLQAMPKGGELHNHLVGSVYAEDYLRWADEDGYCISRAAMAIAPPPCDGATLIPARGLVHRDPKLYQQLIDALSVRNFVPGAATGELSGHDRTFATFGRFFAIAWPRLADTLVSTLELAAGDKVSYLETIARPPQVDAFAAAALDWPFREDRFAASLAALQAKLPELVAQAMRTFDEAEAAARRKLHCDTADARPACAVMVRYLYYIDRGAPPTSVFAQMAFGYALVAKDPRFVGINLVAPEDGVVSRRDFRLHMRMFQLFAARQPGVPLSLHAGELTLGLVPPNDLRFHIGESVAVAGARRIGHGYGLPFEEGVPAMLARMARDRVAVEINLTSNAITPGISGSAHPIQMYRRAGVPLVLASDDEGVFRIDLTHEFVRAAMEQQLGYLELKGMARNGIEYAFVPGASLWQDPLRYRAVPACAATLESDSATPDSACATFIAASEKARLQWQLERSLADFETQMLQAKF